LCHPLRSTLFPYTTLFRSYERDDIEGVDSSIIQNRLVWKYSGHEQTFHDPLVDCRVCKERFRLDKLQDVQCPNHPEVHPGEDKEDRKSTRLNSSHVSISYA